MKAFYSFLAFSLFSSSVALAATPKISQEEIDGAAALAVGAYRSGGMAGIANQSRDCWQNVGLKSYLCLYIDLAGRYLDQSAAKQGNFPLTPYFSNEESWARAAKVYGFNNIDVQSANKHLAGAQTKVNAAVNRLAQ